MQVGISIRSFCRVIVDGSIARHPPLASAAVGWTFSMGATAGALRDAFVTAFKAREQGADISEIVVAGTVTIAA